MATLLSLPLGPEPKKLTAHNTPKNLKEHFLSFLCMNNKQGFLSEEEENKVEQTVADIVYQYTRNKTTTLEYFYSVEKEILLITDNYTTIFRIFPHQVRKLLSRAFGYPSFRELLIYNDLINTDNSFKLDKPFENKRTEGLEKIFIFSPKDVNKYFETLRTEILNFDVNSPRPVFDYETVQGRLILHAWEERSSIRRMKTNAKKIKKLSNGRLRHSEILKLFSIAWGYGEFKEMVVDSKVPDYVFNKRKLTT